MEEENGRPPLDRRIQLLLVDPIAFVNMFKEGMRLKENYQVIKGIPESAYLVGTSVDHETGGMVLVLWSEEFELIPEDKLFPMIRVQLKQGQSQGKPSEE